MPEGFELWTDYRLTQALRFLPHHDAMRNRIAEVMELFHE